MTTDTTPGAAGANTPIMSPAYHLTVIRSHVEAIRRHPHGRPEPRLGHIREITRHADALDAARRDAEARAQRLREIADARGVLLSLASPPACVRSLPRATTLPQWLDAMERHARAETDCRKHGDLDAEPAPARADGGA